MAMPQRASLVRSHNGGHGDEIHDIFEEAKRTNKSFAFVAKQRLQGRAKIQAVISPVDKIPDTAKRTDHKPR